MTIFDRLNEFITQAGTAMKAVGVVIAILAFLSIIGWGMKATLGRIVIGVIVAGGIITVIAKPDLLKSDMENTFSLPAPAAVHAEYLEHESRGLDWAGVAGQLPGGGATSATGVLL